MLRGHTFYNSVSTPSGLNSSCTDLFDSALGSQFLSRVLCVMSAVLARPGLVLATIGCQGNLSCLGRDYKTYRDKDFKVEPASERAFAEVGP